MRIITKGSSGCKNEDAIYVIIRFFNLGTESTRLRIYVHPENKRRTGKLKFVTDAKYTMIPGEVN